MAELAGQTWGGGLGTVSISKDSDGLPWLSRNGQGQDFLLICGNTVLCNSELNSEPFGREYRLTSWQPGVFPISSVEVAQPCLGHFRCSDVSSTLPFPHCSYTAQVLLCPAQLAQPPPTLDTFNLLCNICSVACTHLSCWQERAIVLSKSAAHKPRFSEPNLNSHQSPKIEIPPGACLRWRTRADPGATMNSQVWYCGDRLALPFPHLPLQSPMMPTLLQKHC